MVSGKSYIRGGGRVATARPEVLQSSRSGRELLGIGRHHRIDGVCGASARRGGARLDRLPARRRRPPRRLLRAGDHELGGRRRRSRRRPPRAGDRPTGRGRRRLGARAAGRGQSQGAAARRARRLPARRVRGAREHHRRRELGRPGGDSSAAPPSPPTTWARATARWRRTSSSSRPCPKTPGIVYIGINVGRFTAPAVAPHARPAGADAVAAAVPPAPVQPEQDPQRRQEEGARSRAWLAKRYPVVQEELRDQPHDARASWSSPARSRGLRPVLLELPRDTAIIGTRPRRSRGPVHRRAAGRSPRSTTCRG